MNTFNTGKLRIGSNFQRLHKWEPTRGEERIQAALLDKRSAQPLSLLMRIAGVAWRWL